MGCGLNPDDRFDFLLPGSSVVAMSCGLAGASRADRQRRAWPLKPRKCRCREETRRVGRWSSRGRVWRGVKPHGRQRDSWVWACIAGEGEEPSPTPCGFSRGPRGGEALRSPRPRPGGASPRTQRSAAGSPGHQGCVFARSDAPRPLSRGRGWWARSLPDVAQPARLKAASS